MPYGGVADGWETPDRSSVYRVQKLPPANPRGSVIVYSDVCKDLRAASGPGSLVRHGPGESQPVDSHPLAHVVGGAPRKPRHDLLDARASFPRRDFRQAKLPLARGSPGRKMLSCPTPCSSLTREDSSR